jgi:hypothetical protein
MKTKTVGMIALLVAASVCLLWQANRLTKVEGANRELRTQTASLAALQEELQSLREVKIAQAELARLRASEDSMKQEVARLRGQLGAVLRENAGSGTQAMRQPLLPGVGRPGLPSGSGGVPEPSGMLGGGGLNSATNVVLDAQLARARERLNLTPEQDRDLREVVTKAIEQGTESLRKVLAGEARPDQVPTQTEWAKALEQQILSALTPEQQAAYQHYKREDISTNARLLANGELLLIQNPLGLSSQQQDQMFAVLYDHAVTQMDDASTSSPGRPRDPLAAMQWQGEQKLKALESVLTPAQLDDYRRMQQTHFDSVKSVFSRAAGGEP